MRSTRLRARNAVSPPQARAGVALPPDPRPRPNGRVEPSPRPCHCQGQAGSCWQGRPQEELQATAFLPPRQLHQRTEDTLFPVTTAAPGAANCPCTPSSSLAEAEPSSGSLSPHRSHRAWGCRGHTGSASCPPKTWEELVLGLPRAPHTGTLRGGAEKAMSLPAPSRPSTRLRPPCIGSPRAETRPPSAAHPHCRDEETELRAQAWRGSKPAAGRCSVRARWKMCRLRISVSVQPLATPVLGKGPQTSGRACMPAKLYVQKQAEDQVRSSPSLPTSALGNSHVLTHVTVTNTLGSGNALFPIFLMRRLRPSEVQGEAKVTSHRAMDRALARRVPRGQDGPWNSPEAGRA